MCFNNVLDKLDDLSWLVAILREANEITSSRTHLNSTCEYNVSYLTKNQRLGKRTIASGTCLLGPCATKLA